MNELIGHELTADNNKIKIYFCKGEHIPPEVNVFFLDHIEILIKNGYAGPAYLPSLIDTNLIYLKIDDEVVAHIIWKYEAPEHALIVLTAISEKHEGKGLYPLIHRYYEDRIKKEGALFSRSLLHVANKRIVDISKKNGYHVELLKMSKKLNSDKLEEFLSNKQKGEIIVPAKNYFPPLPEEWTSLDNFIEWYFLQKMPLAVPWNSTMSVTDNTTSVPLFRKFPYLVEMHLLHPGCSIPEHCHPDIEVVVMMMSGGNNHVAEWGDFKRKLSPGEYYKFGEFNKSNNGYVFMTFSKWPKDWIEKFPRTPHHTLGAGIMAEWQGNTTGSIHDEFIKTYSIDNHIDNISKSVVDLDSEPTVFKIDSNEYFKDVVIPETWDTVENFTGWWIKNRMPLMIPNDAEVIVSDDATAVCVFRHGRFQIEFYIIKPHYSIESHCHPGMEIMTLYFAGGKNSPYGARSFHNTADKWGRVRSKLESGEYHGGEDTDVFSGFVLVALQKWDEGIPMTSAAINWTGSTAGPMQEALIKKHRPDAFVEPGYADVTRKN